MIQRIGGFSLGSAIVMFIAASSCSRAEMVQTSCFIDDDVVAFNVSDASHIGEPGSKIYGVSFDEKGAVMKFSPQYYGIRWETVDHVLIEYSHQRDDVGRLSLHVRSALSGAKVKRIGIVQRGCWDAARKFLEQKKIKVRISESPGAPG